MKITTLYTRKNSCTLQSIYYEFHHVWTKTLQKSVQKKINTLIQQTLLVKSELMKYLQSHVLVVSPVVPSFVPLNHPPSAYSDHHLSSTSSNHRPPSAYSDQHPSSAPSNHHPPSAYSDHHSSSAQHRAWIVQQENGETLDFSTEQSEYMSRVQFRCSCYKTSYILPVAQL